MRHVSTRVTVILLFLLCSQMIAGILSPAVSTEQSLNMSSDPTPAMSAISTLIYGLVLLNFLFYWRVLLSLTVSSKLVLLLPLLALLSALWSQDTAVTIRRAIVLLLVSLAGVWIGQLFSRQELSKLVTVTGLLICVCTFAAALFSPHIVLGTVDNGWRGLFTQKNAHGAFMALVVVSAIHSKFDRFAIVKYATILMASSLLLLSRSSTSLVAVVITLAALPLWRLSRVPAKWTAQALIFAVGLFWLTGFLITTYSAELFDVLGKNSTLTGRTQLWGLILNSISRRPLLGYGYNGFWLGLRGESLTIIAASGWIVPHAHNGLLDVLLGLGVVGGIVFLTSFARLLTMLVRDAGRSGATLDVLWPASFIALLVVVNSTESLLLSSNSIFWLLYVAIYAGLSSQSERSYVGTRERTDGPASLPLSTNVATLCWRNYRH